jgi:hypothetical protein
MTQGMPEATLTIEERAEVMRIQERLIDLLDDRGEALSTGDKAQADALRHQIDDLKRERDDIKMWATAK